MNQVPDTKCSRAIVTLTMGDAFWRMAEITHPFMRQYAHRCKAEFLIINEPRLHERLVQLTYEKFQVYDLLDKYQRIIFIDTDILISPDTPNLFDLVPQGRFGAASEAGYSQSERHKKITQEVLGKVNWESDYFNSGMMIFSRNHKKVFDPNADKLTLWATGETRQQHDLTDQPYLNYRINEFGIPLVDVGFRYNHTRVIKNTKIRFRSYLIHYSGPSGHRYGTRLEQIKKDAIVLNSPTRLWLSKNFLFYRWVSDRLNLGFLKYLYEQYLLNLFK